MIPNDKEFDVYVSEGVMVEVWRGQHISVATSFGVEWDGAPHHVMYSTCFEPPSAPGVTTERSVPETPEREPAWRALVRRVLPRGWVPRG